MQYRINAVKLVQCCGDDQMLNFYLETECHGHKWSLLPMHLPYIDDDEGSSSWVPDGV